MPINSEREASSLIANYFGQSKASSSSHEVSISYGKRHLRADIVLEFGPYTVIVETKYGHGRDTRLVKMRVEQTKVLMDAGGIVQGVVVIFQKADIPLGLDNVKKFHNGHVYSIVVKA